MKYQEFRNGLVVKGFIVRGDQRAMTIFTPAARLEVQYVGEALEQSMYTVYNYTKDETLSGKQSLANVSALIMATNGEIDLYSWYSADWKVRFKGNSLYTVGQLLEKGEAEPNDLSLALALCDQINYLILLSDYIPDEVKKDLCKDILSVKEGFVSIKL